MKSSEVSSFGKLTGGHELNAICPYFTMFPLEFPLQILRRHSSQRDRVLDPFCGRGTTNFAARLNNLDSVGIDNSPVAQAITAAKLVSPAAQAIEDELRTILREAPSVTLRTIGTFDTTNWERSSVLLTFLLMRFDVRGR